MQKNWSYIITLDVIPQKIICFIFYLLETVKLNPEKIYELVLVK